ncbi:MAG: thiamine diphosphokinase [Oscillospiraceae bacterium]
MEAIIKNRCVIVAAGELDNLDLLKNNILNTDFIIAADGGYKKCINIGLIPDLIVGDFDSSKVPKIKTEIIKLNPIKDSTDTENALLIGAEKGFKDFTIFGATGGRFDHTFANIALISSAIEKNINCTIIDDHHKIYFLKNETHKIKNENKYISIFAYGGDCVVSLNGFFYPLNSYTLSANSALGTSNEITADYGEITVHKGKLLIIECEKFN